MKYPIKPSAEAGTANPEHSRRSDAWRLLEPLASSPARSELQRIAVERLAYHSAAVRPGDLFFCLPGGKNDGHEYAQDAALHGAAGIVASRFVDVSAPLILVNDTRLALSLASARFFDNPGERMNLIGVTGTNGKTTTTYYLQNIYHAAGKPTAIIGSNGLLYDGWQRSFQLTTPVSLELHESLAFLLKQGVHTVAMEVSSHALMQHRVSHCCFNSAVVTNITRDHLDYHGTMKSYLDAKGKLFNLLKQGRESGVILNTDADYFMEMEKRAQGINQVLYGIDNPRSVIRPVNISAGSDGRYCFQITGWATPPHVSLKLPGLFNVYNALAAAAAAWKDGLPAEAVEKGLNNLNTVPGRLEEIAADPGFTVIIDYAHTPDGLEQVLKLLKFRRPRRIITVFGCPGERDRGKRPLMGRISERYSDLVVVTADNPAGEDVSAISGEIRKGMHSDPVLIEDRKTAVHFALEQAGPGDIVLLAGKGAEEFQLIGKDAVTYNERKVVEEFLHQSAQILKS